MIDRRAFLGTLAGGLLAAPLAAEAQPSVGRVRVGILVPATANASAGSILLFKQGLADRGYVEGRNVAYEFRFSDRPDQISDQAMELVRLKVDILVTSGTIATAAAKRATTSVPIVMIGVYDPVKIGLVASLSHPGGNITGNAILMPEMTAKHLELLKEAVPRVVHIAVLWNHENPATHALLTDIQDAAGSLGLRADGVSVTRAEDIDSALASVERSRPDALLVVTDPVIIPHLGRIAEFALKTGKPGITLFKEFAVAGGLLAYGPSLRDLLGRATGYVDRILKGARPGDLPIQQPTTFELAINLKTAKALGLTIPPSLLQRADQVIE